MWQLPHNQVAGEWDEGGGTCVRERLRRMVEKREQYRFVAGKGTIDAIFILRQLQEKYLKNDKKLHLVFLDL